MLSTTPNTKQPQTNINNIPHPKQTIHKLLKQQQSKTTQPVNNKQNTKTITPNNKLKQNPNQIQTQNKHNQSNTQNRKTQNPTKSNNPKSPQQHKSKQK